MGRARQHRPASPGDGDDYQPPKIGAVLLDLRNALIRAERCRRLLQQQGFSQERWMEIAAEVDPEFRFMVRPPILDAIVERLESAGKPVSRAALARDLAALKVGALERVEQTITTGLRARKLARFANHAIGLPEWKKRKDGGR